MVRTMMSFSIAAIHCEISLSCSALWHVSIGSVRTSACPWGRSALQQRLAGDMQVLKLPEHGVGRTGISSKAPMRANIDASRWSVLASLPVASAKRPAGAV